MSQIQFQFLYHNYLYVILFDIVYKIQLKYTIIKLKLSFHIEIWQILYVCIINTNQNVQTNKVKNKAWDKSEKIQKTPSNTPSTFGQHLRKKAQVIWHSATTAADSVPQVQYSHIWEVTLCPIPSRNHTNNCNNKKKGQLDTSSQIKKAWLGLWLSIVCQYWRVRLRHKTKLCRYTHTFHIDITTNRQTNQTTTQTDEKTKKKGMS